MSEENNRPIVTITADEYFDLRSRAEASTYVAQNIEGFRADLNECKHQQWNLEERIKKLEGK